MKARHDRVELLHQLPVAICYRLLPGQARRKTDAEFPAGAAGAARPHVRFVHKLSSSPVCWAQSEEEDESPTRKMTARPYRRASTAGITANNLWGSLNLKTKLQQTAGHSPVLALFCTNCKTWHAQSSARSLGPLGWAMQQTNGDACVVVQALACPADQHSRCGANNNAGTRRNCPSWQDAAGCCLSTSLTVSALMCWRRIIFWYVVFGLANWQAQLAGR